MTEDKRKHRPRTLRRIAKRKSEREAALEKFGEAADERKSKQDRREAKSQEETERILKEMGITDRRRMDRRGRGSW